MYVYTNSVMNQETSVKHSMGEEIVERNLDFFIPLVRGCLLMCSCVCVRVCVPMHIPFRVFGSDD
jgi:hypothetical protein